MLVALFGITNDGLNLFVNLVVLFLVVVWVALIAWTYQDARRRIQDPVLVACATGASLFPYVGTVVYSILRPPEYLEDAHERELEIRAAELRVKQLEEQSCPACGYPIERTYLRCPSCRTRVKDPCESCQKPIDPRWTICPYCETPQRRAPAEPRRAARGRRLEERPATRSQRVTRETGRAASTQGRTTSSRQTRSTSSRQPPATSSRKSSSGRSGPNAPATRETAGEERPRPAPAS
jgi:hypothetical protein